MNYNKGKNHNDLGVINVSIVIFIYDKNHSF